MAEASSLSYTSRVGELGEMAGVFSVQTVVYKNKTADMTCHIPIERNLIVHHRRRVIGFTGHNTITEYLHLSGGVSVIVCAVNSSSKYRVSVSDVTCGLKSGVS